VYKQKIPKRVLPPGLEERGEITIVCRAWTKVQSTYTISTTYGRICISGWKKFMEKEKKSLVVGNKVLMQLWLGNRGLFLFVSLIPELKL
jgi:hypothetical protein